MPVPGIKGRECPPHCLHGDAMSDMDILSYVYSIVVIDEIALNYLQECHKRGNGQEKANQRNLLVS
jgi:hypothetical protein